MLCLHGFPDTAWTWRHLGPALADRGRRVVAPFMRGYAPTGLAPGDDYSIRALASDALALRDALGGDGSAALVGHDWGAVAAYAVPAGSFARVVTLAVPPPAVLWRLPPRLAARQARRSWYMAFNQLPAISDRALPGLAPRLWSAWSPGYDAAEDLARLRESWPTPAHRRAALRYYRALSRGARALPHSATPLPRRGRVRPSPLGEGSGEGRGESGLPLCLHGADDGCLLVDVARRGGAEVVEGAGHFLHLERPELVNARIADYVGG